MNAQLLLVLSLFGMLGLASQAHAAPALGPELNPFSCPGDAEVASADRSIAQIRGELAKKLDPPFAASDPLSVRAQKLCVIAQLKARVGDTDASDYFEQASALNPDEPGYDLFAGNYYAGARGAKGPVLESAEKYFYRALEKLEKLRQSGRYRGFHGVVQDHVQRGLLNLYQADGVPLLPWKAFPQTSRGYLAPGLSLATQIAVSRDTRDSLGGSDTQAFTAEAGLFKVRHERVEPSARNLYDIARQPLRLTSNTELRLRHTHLGAVDLSYGTVHAERAAITAFVDPSVKNDIDVKQVGVAYERVIPLYPLFDFKLALGVKRVERRGVVESSPNCSQTFPVYEARPSVSRFISSDKLTINGVFVLMDIPDVPCDGQPKHATYLDVRGRAITGLNLEYAIYSPLLLPALGLGSLRPYRTTTRGLYLSAGYVNDNEVFGDHRAVNETFFAGARLEGPGAYDIAVQETYYVASGTKIVEGLEQPDSDISGHILRSALTVTRRLTNPDETPGVPSSWGPFAHGSLNWVFPLSFDKVVSGYDQLENLRAGTALWWKIHGTGLWGSTVLLSAGYDYEYFYHLGSAGHRHNVGITLRIGWRDL